MLFIGILSLIFITYLTFHVVAYFSIVRFFAVVSLIVKRIIFTVLLFLGGSFFAAMWLVHRWDNLFTRDYYFFAGSWIGLLINLVLFFILAWILVAIGTRFQMIGKEKMIGIIAICMAIVYSAYGIWNAFTPRVTHIDVPISNLPETWVGKKIVQISDIHLGSIYSAQYFESVVQKINALKPDIIVITGDLFDGMDGIMDGFVQPLSELEAPGGIYYATGNHETYLGIENTLEIIGKTKITLLRDEMRTVDGLQIVGIDYPERMETKNVSAVINNLPEFDPKKPSIMLWHQPTQIDQAKAAGISLQLSGHTHSGQLFPLGFITHLIFKGYDYGLKQEGNYSIYTSSGLGGWGAPMRTEKTSEIVEMTLQKM